MRVCVAPGCGQPCSGYSRHCDRHKATLRRHGAIDQRGVTKADLQPYADMVRRRILSNPESPAWDRMEARWAALVRHCQDVISAYQGGFATAAPKLRAAEEIVRLDGLVPARDVVVTAAAMVVMDRLDPHRFRGDKAFRTQLVRRVRGLTEVNATTYRDWATGRSRRTYRELAPRSAEVMGAWLQETLGVLGYHIARLEQEQAQSKRKDDRDLYDALVALK
jgi:hypothetical protein